MRVIFKYSTVLLLSLPILGRCNDASEGGGDPRYGGNILTNWVGRPGQDPIEPTRDAFYSNIPRNLTDYNNGQIIDMRTISISGSYQGIESAFQIRVRSENAHDEPALGTATVIIPAANYRSRAADSKRIISYQLAEDSTFINCAPTYQLFTRGTVPEIQAMINQGFIVVIPDYEGQRGSYTVGKVAGKQILDAVKGALTIPTEKVNNSTDVSIGIWGYGTAAHATGWAAELAKTYAPDLPLKATALGGVITNLINWIYNINNTVDADQVISSLLGMASEYRDVSDALAYYVLPRRRNQFQGAASRCSLQNKLRFFNTDVNSQFFAPGMDIFAMHKVQNVYNLNSLGKSAPTSGVFIYRGSDDTLVTLKDIQNLMKVYCGGGTPVKYGEISNASHNSAHFQFDEVLDYFNTVLSGAPQLNSCQRMLGPV